MIVTIYSTPTCPWCYKIKDYFNSKEIKFTEVNVAENRAGAAEMIQKSGQRSVPVTDIDGDIIVGFNQAEIEKLISKHT